MSTIQDLFQQAQLAEAAYADFINPDTGAIYNTDAGIQRALIASGFSSDPNSPTQSAQASDFVLHWQVVSQFSERGVDGLTDGNGFSATLFESRDHPGQYVFAVRGSELLVDFAEADFSLLAGGLAFDQLLSMVNYVLRLQAGSNGHTRQVELLSASGATAPSLTTSFVNGVGPGIAPAQLTIAGHSLGGYLGQMYHGFLAAPGSIPTTRWASSDPAPRSWTN